jgi:hypothetical protein
MSTPGDEVSQLQSYRFEGFAPETIWQWLNGCPGANVVQPGIDYLKQMADDNDSTRSDLRAQLSKIGAGWSGQAATSASGALTQLADHSESAVQTSTAGSTHLDRFGQNFTAMKNQIQQELIDEGQQSTGGRILDGMMGAADGAFGIQSDYRRRLQANQAAFTQAVGALNSYRDTTVGRLTDFDVGQPVPKVAATGPGTDRPTSRPPAKPDKQPPGSSTQHPNSTHTNPDTHSSTSTANAEPPATTPGADTPGHTDPRLNNGPGPGVPSSTTPSTALPPRFAQEHDSTTNRPDNLPRPTRRGPYPPLPERAPGQPSLITEALLGPEEAATMAAEKSAGLPGGMPTMGGAGRDQEREHRNNTFIPSDEPFHVEFTKYKDYVPPVLGLDDDGDEDR